MILLKIVNLKKNTNKARVIENNNSKSSFNNSAFQFLMALILKNHLL